MRENRDEASEIKFLVCRRVAEQIRAWSRSVLAPDPHAGGEHGDGYRISSLYFDTANFDVFHRRGSYGRSKFRVRRYGAGEIVFLERKLKVKGMLTKRRSSVPIAELGRLDEPVGDCRWGGHWFQRRIVLRAVRPVCQISYNRTARAAMTHLGPVRLTLDEDLRGVAVDRTAFRAQRGLPLLPEHVVVEMKFLVCMPAIFKCLIEEFGLNPVRFSKYRLGARELGLAREAEVRSCPACPIGTAR